MEIQKKRIVLVVLVVVSLVVGGLMTARSNANLMKDREWHKVVSQKDPAFSFYMPNAPRHTVGEVVFDKQPLQTASLVSNDNTEEYAMSITNFPIELHDLYRTEIFNFALKLLMPDEEYVLLDYKPLYETANFKIAMKNGGERKQGRMTFEKGFLFLQMVTYQEGDFSQEDYDKFIESLKL